MNMKKIKVKIGDYIFQFVGDAMPKKYRENDKIFICKYIVTDIMDSVSGKKKIIQIKNDCNITIPANVNHFWFGDLINDYEIERMNENKRYKKTYDMPCDRNDSPL